MSLTMYGIPNCNTIKKARSHLDAQGVAYQFHNYKKDGIDENRLQSWCKLVDWKTLLNQRGTTWRKLSEEEKSGLDEAKAVRLMSSYPSMIKRPVLLDSNHSTLLVGYSEDVYNNFLSKAGL